MTERQEKRLYAANEDLRKQLSEARAERDALAAENRRLRELLKAACDLIDQCDEAQYTEIRYDEAVCDGFCLMGDIDAFLQSTGEKTNG